MSQTFDTPDWQKSALTPFANLDAFGHVGGGQDLVVNTPLAGGLGGIVGVATSRTAGGVVTITGQPSGVVLYFNNDGSGTERTFLVTLDQFAPGDDSIRFECSASGASAEALLRAYAISETALVVTDPRFPLAVATQPAPFHGGESVVNPAKGNLGVINLPAPGVGLRYLIQSYVASVTQDVLGAPGTGVPSFWIIDSSGTIWQEVCAMPAIAATTSRVASPAGFALPCAYNSAVSLTFSAAVPNCFEVISAGYLVTS